MRSVIVDCRWSGRNGISRYAAEVVPRLRVPWRALRGRSRPASARDLLTPRFATKQTLFYMPGYNARVGNSIQLVTVHDLIHLRLSSAKYRLYYESILKPTIRRAGVVFTVSETSRDAISSWLGTPSINIVNTGNGCSEVFTPGLAESGYPFPYILFIGNLKRHKNVEVILRALALMKDSDTRVVAVTSSPEKFHRYAVKFLPARRIVSVGGLEDVSLRDLYRGAIVTALPSTTEGFGLPALESLRCGTPVAYLATCESVREIVRDAGPAVQSATDPSEWGDAMEGCIGHRVGASTLDRLDQYSWSRVASVVSTTIENAST